MASRAALCTILVFALGLAGAAQPRFSTQSRFDDGFSLDTGSISGKVVRGTRQVVAGAQVDIEDLETFRFVAHTETRSDGSFAVSPLPSGRYAVLVTAGTDQAREEVEVTWAPENVIVRLPEVASDAGSRERVSVNQLRAPKKAREAVRKAQEALRRGDLDLARQQVERALDAYPQYAEALSLRGLLELNAAHPDQARADLEEAVRCDPGDPVPFVFLATTYNRLQRFDDALQASQRGIALAPKVVRTESSPPVPLAGAS